MSAYIYTSQRQSILNEDREGLFDCSHGVPPKENLGVHHYMVQEAAAELSLTRLAVTVAAASS